MSKARDKRLREGLLLALLAVRELDRISLKLAGEILERWDELVAKEAANG